ncbi:MAG: class I SAM-dependent methyltransferase [Romboutsia sp.]
MLDNKGFDLWSKDYDKSVERSSKEYPFDGYYEILNYIYNSITNRKTSKVLDIGFGTGLLTHRLYEDGVNIFGIDFSQGMVDIAKKKMPNGVFIQHDFNLGIPVEIKDERFDYIISSYAIHHLEDDKKVQFIGRLKDLLVRDGKIIIGDVGFKTKNQLLECRNYNLDKWDEDEIYIVEEKIIPELRKNGVNGSYAQISSCAGIIEVDCDFT